MDHQPPSDTSLQSKGYAVETAIHLSRAGETGGSCIIRPLGHYQLKIKEIDYRCFYFTTHLKGQAQESQPDRIVGEENLRKHLERWRYPTDGWFPEDLYTQLMTPGE